MMCRQTNVDARDRDRHQARRNADTQKYRYVDVQTQINRQANIQTNADRHTHRHRDSDMQTHIQKCRDTQTYRNIQGLADTHIGYSPKSGEVTGC